MNPLAKKLFAVASSVAMVAASLPLVASAAPHAAGTNVVSNGTVYFLDGSAKRPYTSAGAFLSYGFNSWSNVVAASAEDLALPTGAFVPPMDGSLINDNGTVYLITNGQRAGFTSAANFLGLGYSFANVVAGDTSFMASLSPIGTTAMAHPAGTLVNQSGTVYLMSNSGKMGIPSLSVFNSWGYSFGKVVPANSYDVAIAMSNGIMPARSGAMLSPLSGGGVVLPGGPMSISMAGPASSTLVATQGQAKLADFTFNGSGTVTSVTLKRLGVSADTSLVNVFLFDGGVRVTDAASVTSGGMINFTNANGLFNVNGSKTISVVADLNATAGETIGLQLSSYAVSNGSANTANVNGNLHTVASATLASFSLASATDAGNSDPGSDLLVWQGTATVGTRDVLMSRLALRQIGSINMNDIRNFKLLVDGVQVASASSLDSNGYVTFNFSKALMTGTRTIKVTADVIGGSGRTVEMSLRGSYDVTVTDTQYNAIVRDTTTSYPFDADGFTVNAGTMTVIKATDSQSANVTRAATDQSLAKYTFTAYGESVKVETLRVGVITTGGTVTNHTLRNVRILANGVQVGSTTNVPAEASFATNSGTSFTTNFMVNPGSPVTVELRGDLFDSEGTNEIADGTVTAVQALLVGSTGNAVPQVSLGTIPVPVSNVLGNTLTVSAGTTALAKQSNYGNRNVIVPQTAYKVAAFNLSASNTEDINVNTFTLTFTTGGTNTFSAADLSDVYIVYGTQQTSVKSTVSGSDAYSVSFTLPKNSSIPVEVYANINSGAITADDTLIVNVAVTATAQQSGTAANVSATAGQTLTAKTSGTITAAKDASSPLAAIVADNQTIDTAAFSFTTVNDSYVITDITVTVDNASAVQNVILKDASGATIATRPGATSVAFNGLNIPAAVDAVTVVRVALQLGTVGVSAGTTGSEITTGIAASGATARSNATGTSATVSGLGSEVEGNDFYVYAALPTVARDAVSSVLSTGTVTLAKFTITASGGPISWDELLFNVTKTAGAGEVAITSPTLWDVTGGGNTQVAGSATVTTLADTNASGTIAFDATAEEQISSSKTYALKATVTSTAMSTGDNINTSLNQPSSFAASVAAASVGATASLVWSDRSAASHSTTTTDWTNDYGVKNLPLDSWTLIFN